MKIQKTQQSPNWTTNPTILVNALNTALSTNGVKNIFVPMGSGKTHSVKTILNNRKAPVIVIAPYLGTRTDYAESGAVYSRGITNTKVESHTFCYISSIISGLRAVALETFLDCSTQYKHIAKIAALTIAENNKDLSFILDEYDAVLIQSRMDTNTEVKNGQSVTTKDYSLLMQHFLLELGLHFPVIKLSATKDPEDFFGEDIIVPLGTTVRTPIINNYIQANKPKEDTLALVSSLIDKATWDGRPVIVYSSHFSWEYYSLMNTLASSGISTLLLTNNDRLATKVDELSNVISYAHETFDFIKYKSADLANVSMSLQANVLIVNPEDSEDFQLETLHNKFMVIFVNMNQTRNISILKENLTAFNSSDFMEIISIGSVLTTAAIQAVGRPRDIAVIVHNILTGDIKASSKSKYEGDTGYTFLQTLSPCANEYGIEEINLFKY